MLTGLAGTIAQQARSSLYAIEVDVKQFVQLCKSQWARLLRSSPDQSRSGDNVLLSAESKKVNLDETTKQGEPTAPLRG